MKNKKIFLLILMLLVCILSVQALSATEYTANKEVTSIDNNQKNNIETNIQYDDVSTENKNDELILEENNNDEERKSETDKTTADNAELTFTDLNTAINDNTNSTIYLSNNYKYSSTDNFKDGIPISRDLTIYGNGATIDGNKQARIFQVTNSNLNVKFYNINFINGKSSYGGAISAENENSFNAYNCTFTGNNATTYHGGAIYKGNAYNCTFTGNIARDSGGAIYRGSAYNCTFINNKAASGGAIYLKSAYNCTFTGNNATKKGGAMYKENAYNCTFRGNNAPEGGAIYQGSTIFCTFNGDTTYQTTIIPAIINVLNYTSTKGSGEKLKFNLTANNTIYDGFNTTIKIYNGTSLLKTVYGLTGEGWVVDLDVGEYTAVLSLTDYPDENSTDATITVTDDKTPTTTTITSGNSSEIGKPFSTTATITDPDGQAVTSGKANFTVTKDSEIVYTEVKDVKDGLTFTWTPESLGTCTLKITYIPEEGSEYSSSEDTQTFTVTEDKIPTTTTITSGSSSAVGKATVIKAKIIGNDGKKVSGDVLLKITNKKTGKTIVEKNITIKSGTLSYTWTPTQAGEYTINLKYKGNSQYEDSSAQQKYQVKSEDTIIVKNVKMNYGDGTKFIVKALNAQGKPKAKLAVNVKVAGKTFKLTTNSKGIAQLAIKLDPNTYKVITTVPGTSIKKVSTITVNKWEKSLTSLKPKNLVKVYKTNKRFYVTLKYNKVPIAGEYIKVQVRKYTYYIKTNNKGVASLGIHFKPGTWKAKVSIDLAGVKLTKTAKIVVKKR